ncbi:hypothetical protein EI94DRAFT_1771396 [Lactarius quietus]|nr:hypothetical protein EI94DRAFT_1771396 [Lactarius quietus]
MLDTNYQQPHDWKPFEDCLAFDLAYYHYVTLQSSASGIAEGLNLWSATSFKHGSSTGAPWKSVKDMYKTIDAIQMGSLPFHIYHFHYTRLKLSTPPHWMEQVYKLNACNVLDVIQDQLAMIAFKDQFDSTPYQEFNSNGDHIWSNLMSGHWAYKQALSQDQTTQGAMFVPIIARSDKTSVSAATGYQEYHPVYILVGNLSNTAHQACRNGVLPVAFLPIPKGELWSQQKCPEYHCFCWQLFHKCLKVVFKPLRKYMTSPTVVKCSDGLFCHAIFGLGPYISDYPEQVWVMGIILGWCAHYILNFFCYQNLNSMGHPRRWLKMDYLIKKFDARILWDAFGIYEDVMPFTYNFPHANIHKLISSDLLHQVIKGIFKDHLVSYNLLHRIAIVPLFPGLWWFPDRCNFLQWTGDDSKVVMKVYLGALARYLPLAIVHCILTFMDTCYITCWNSISSLVLKCFQKCVVKYHELCNVFLTTGTLKMVSLPCQHALSHYHFSIQLFGSPNGLCSSITESKHRVSVKNNWYQSNHNNMLPQMMKSLLWWEKLAEMTAAYMADITDGEDPQEDPTPPDSGHSASGPDKDGMAVDGVNNEETLSIVSLSVRTGASTGDYVSDQCFHY